jgi:hypothetical protein
MEFRRLIREWRDEIVARREKQLISHSSSLEKLTSDSTTTSENPSEPPKTRSQIYSQKTYPVTSSSPNSSSPQTPVSLLHPSTLEKQSTKDTTTPPPSHDHYPKSNPLGQPLPKIQPPLTSKFSHNDNPSSKTPSEKQQTKNTHIPIKTQIPHLIPHHVLVRKQRPNKQMQQRRLTKKKENPPTKRPPRKRWKRLLHCPHPRCIPKLCRSSSAPASVVTQLDRAVDSQSFMFRVLWFRRRKKKKFLLFGWFKKPKKKKKKKLC